MIPRLKTSFSPLFLVTTNSRVKWLFGAWLVVFSICVGVRLICGFTFPIPWNDEADFIAQAYAFSQTGSFFVSALNPDRIVMWIPPGYMLLLSAGFKTFGYSFDLARWLSTVSYVMSYAVCLALIINVLRTRFFVFAVCLSLIVFISPYGVAISNLARMESFYTLILFLSLFAAITGWLMVGLLLVISALLVHHNAIYFLPAYMVLFIWLFANKKFNSLNKLEVVFLIFVGLSVISYAYFIYVNWSGFLADIAFQLNWVRRGGSPYLLALYVFPIILLIRFREFSSAVFLGFYGVAFVLFAVYGNNMWYWYGLGIGGFLMLLSMLVVLSSQRLELNPSISVGLIAVSLMVLVFVSHIYKMPHFAPLWPRLELIGRDFIAKEEFEKVSNFIRQAPPNSTFTFGRYGIESFFFKDLLESGHQWNYTIYSVTQIEPFRSADYRIRCGSKLLPASIFFFDWEGFPPKKGVDSGCEIINLSKSRSSN